MTEEQHEHHLDDLVHTVEITAQFLPDQVPNTLLGIDWCDHFTPQDVVAILESGAQQVRMWVASQS